MTRGPLTPLGKQLCSVLVKIRPASSTLAAFYERRAPIRAAILSNISLNPARSSCAYHASSRAQSLAATGAASPSDEETSHEPPQSPVRTVRPLPSRRRLNRRTRLDRITEVLRRAGRFDVAPIQWKGKLDLSHVNVANRHGRRDHKINAMRHSRDRIPDLMQTKEISLSHVLAKYIQHRESVADTGQAEWMTPFNLHQDEVALLETRGYGVDNIKVWADVISEPDPLEAVTALSSQVTTHGPHSVPLFVLLYILRRPYLGSQALRLLIQPTRMILAYRSSQAGDGHIPTNAAFMTFSRLIRHAREVWPRALESLPEILLEQLPFRTSGGSRRVIHRLAKLTHMLNKAMWLLAVPTAIEPFKDNDFQEAGIVRVLRHMAEHNPPLQMNREGYRAVILVQLAQKKTPKEREWAELKALSWPPWKEERTAMDSDITRERHGTSKAGETLLKMREAGYGFHNWEKVASIYSGWDTDGTPTIQTLAVLGTGEARFRTSSAAWVARITTTRTAQEAWACYLAYDDKKLPPNQDVYLAVLQKLHQEEERQLHAKLSTARSKDGRRRLFAGDTKEVEPPPPSTHLHTYTRTAPPGFDGFYRHLCERGIVLDGHCLAFMIANARSLKLGIEYIEKSSTRHPSLLNLFNLDSNMDLTLIPMPIFAAFTELLARYSNVPLSSALHRAFIRVSWTSTTLLGGEHLNLQHGLVHAIELLKQRRPLFRPAWNSVLRGLCSGNSLENIRTTMLRDTNEVSKPLPGEHITWLGTITACRLVSRVLGMMKENHLDLDIHGLLALCRAFENAAVGSWMIMRARERYSQNDSGTGIHEAIQVVQSPNYPRRLKREFWRLVGHDRAEGSDPKSRNVSCHELSFLEIPSPALLHAYVRSLGWMADYNALLETVRWMVANKGKLAERRDMDRNGDEMMRLAIVALRVFLERSWLSTDEIRGPGLFGAGTKKHVMDTPLEKQLRRLQSPASKDVAEMIQTLVENVDDWGGWPEDNEVEEYCQNDIFAQFR